MCPSMLYWTSSGAQCTQTHVLTVYLFLWFFLGLEWGISALPFARLCLLLPPSLTWTLKCTQMGLCGRTSFCCPGKQQQGHPWPWLEHSQSPGEEFCFPVERLSLMAELVLWNPKSSIAEGNQPGVCHPALSSPPNSYLTMSQRKGPPTCHGKRRMQWREEMPIVFTEVCLFSSACQMEIINPLEGLARQDL